MRAEGTPPAEERHGLWFFGYAALYDLLEPGSEFIEGRRGGILGGKMVAGDVLDMGKDMDLVRRRLRDDDVHT